MAIHWIPACKAVELLSGETGFHEAASAIVSRAAAGIVEARAERLTIDSRTGPNRNVPSDFWEVQDKWELRQDWTSGDFENAETDPHMFAFGVRFSLDGILEMLPLEKRAQAIRAISVVGNPDWATADLVRDIAVRKLGRNHFYIGSTLLDYCRTGLLTGRAVLAQMSRTRPHGKEVIEEREWDIPAWFWSDFTASQTSSQDWTRGHFSGKGAQGGYRMEVTLTGVHFLRSCLECFDPPNSDSTGDDDPTSALPALSDAELNRWWNSKRAVRDKLTQTELLTLIRGAFPQNYISRERVRALTGNRKRGPK